MLQRNMSDVKVVPDQLPPPMSAVTSIAAPTAIRGPSAIQIPLQIETGGDRPLHEQISDQIRLSIVDGKLRPGSYIPSSRQLADHLGVSRNTVLLAFNRLASEGYIEATKGSHTFVSQTYEKFRRPRNNARPRVTSRQSNSPAANIVSRRSAEVGAHRPKTNIRFFCWPPLPALLSASHLAQVAAQAACRRRLIALRISASGGTA